VHACGVAGSILILLRAMSAMIQSLRRAGLVSAVCVLFAMTGCGGGDNRPVPDAKQQAVVTGSLVNDGKPLPLDYMVVFNSKDKGAIGSGKLDSLGKFRVTAGDSAIGLPAGRYVVKIAPPAPPPVGGLQSDSYKSMMMNTKMKSATADLPKDVPAKFLSWDTSGLVFELVPGPNTFDIDLAKLAK
jgi:hypothetical protein